MSRKAEVQSGREEEVAALRASHESHGEIIRGRLKEFSRIWRDGTEEELFAELCFCLLTPQTNARACDAVVQELVQSGLLLTGRQDDFAPLLAKKVRFHRNKSLYLVRARETFSTSGRLVVGSVLHEQRTPTRMREWLVRNVLGLGYKEASHFLRNIGLGGDLAILDRHILGNLLEHGVLQVIPHTLSKSRYLEIEEEMRGFAAAVSIPMAELDLLLWSKETGEVLK